MDAFSSKWEAWSRNDGMVNVQLSNGEIIVVKNDGVTGFSFVLDYLERMSEHYGNHLKAMDLLLKASFGDQYENIRRIPNIYKSNLALASMNCLFGTMDCIPDCDENGDFHPEFTACPCRARCPYNGYAERNSGKVILGCNPIYETGLTPTQAKVADLKANSSMTNAEIAQVLSTSEKNIEYHSKQIYAKLQVKDRCGLILKLKDKRLI